MNKIFFTSIVCLTFLTSCNNSPDTSTIAKYKDGKQIPIIDSSSSTLSYIAPDTVIVGHEYWAKIWLTKKNQTIIKSYVDGDFNNSLVDTTEKKLDNCRFKIIVRNDTTHYALVPIDSNLNYDIRTMTPDNLKVDFDEIFKRTIIPFFKDLGFKRKTQHFARQIGDITQCFNVQKSQWNSYRDSIDFTFNFGFYNSDIAEIVSENKSDLEFPKTYDCFIQNRLGTFSHKRDHWYTLSKNIDVRKTAEQIKTDLEKYLRPLFENYLSLQSLTQFINKDEKYISSTLSPYYLIVFYMLTDQQHKGRQAIKDHYKIALTPQTVTDTVNFPDGRKEVKTKTFINQYYIDGIKKLADKYGVDL